MKIEFPIQTTYYICKRAEFQLITYGKVTPKQSMETPEPIVETFFDIELWKIELLRYGVELEDEII